MRPHLKKHPQTGCRSFFAWCKGGFKYNDTRDDFWDYVINNFDVDISVELYGLENDEFIDSLLGGDLHTNIDDADKDRFLSHCINFLCKLDSLF